MKKTRHAFANWLGVLTLQRAVGLVVVVVFGVTWLVPFGGTGDVRRRGVKTSGRASRAPASVSMSSSGLKVLDFQSHSKIAELNRLLVRGELCDFLASLRASQVTTPELATVLPDSQPGLKMVRALYAKAPPPDDLSDASEPARFISALQIGGMFPVEENEPELKIDAPRAIQLLTDLIRENSSNGAYAAYRAVMRKVNGEPAEAIQKDLLLASESPDFDVHTRWLSRSIYEWGLQSPAQYMASMSLISSLPIPNYIGLMSVVRRELGRSDESFARAIEGLGRTMMKSQSPSPERREFIDWIAIEYQTGLTIAKEAWPKTHGADPLPPELTKTYRDFLSQDSPYERWSPFFGPDQPCDPVQADALLEYELKR